MPIRHTITPPKDTSMQSQFLKTCAREGVHQRFGVTLSNPQTESEKKICRRLDQEVKSVVGCGRVNQFLMLRDIVSYANSHDIPISPGYGITPGSLLAYALNISKVDPYGYDLIHEGSRFLSATFGINISARRCDEIICYLKKQDRPDYDASPVELVEMPVLDVVQDMLILIRKNSGIAIDLDNIPLDDKATYELLRQGNTLGVYQLESKAARRYLQEWAPTCMSDIFALTALNRYGAENLIPLVIASKNKDAPVSFYHPMLEPVTMETYGIVIYQDQVTRAAKLLAGYTSEQGEKLRSVLGAKHADKVAEEQLNFVNACDRVNGIAPHQAKLLFDVLEGCAVYAFPKPHAVAHGLLTYQMAYLKTHFRAEFESVRKQWIGANEF